MNPLLKYRPVFQAPDAPNTSPGPGGTPPAAASPPAPGETAPPKPGDAAPPSLAGTEPKPGEAPAAPEPKPGEKPPEAPTAFDATKLVIPEGIAPDDPRVAEFTKLFTDEKLPPQDRAQSLLNLHHSALKEASEASSVYWADVRKGWVDEVKADAEIGGVKLEPTLAGISKMIDTLGPDESKGFRAALDMSGIGDNPAVIRALATWSKLFTEGGHITGTPPGQAQAPDLAKTFFPNSNMKG